MNSTQESIPPLDCQSNKYDTNTMAGADIQLPTFNGNGAEDPEQHWFIYEVVWMVCLVHNMGIRKAHMFMTLRGHVLDWVMKFCVVPPRTP